MINEILILHHTHTDIGYTHEPPVVWELNRQFIDDALDEIERTASWDKPSRPIWTCEVTETLRHWLMTTTPQQIERFKQAIKAGRMSGCAMPYNFTPMVGVPQFIRALAYLPELRDSLGLKFNVALNHDINGLPWTMIPLMLDAGIEMVMMGINVHFGAFPLTRPLFFKWKGPDGRSILALNGEHYGMFQRYARLDEGSLNAMAEGIANYLRKLEAQGYPHDFAYLSLTHYSFWDNNPPYPAAFELIHRWNEEGRTPRIRFVTPDDLLAKAKAMTHLPEYAGDWTDYWNFGTGSSAHETRMAHQARADLYATDVLSLQRHAPRDYALSKLVDDAYANLTLWDEHTWGGYDSIVDPDRDPMIAGWYHKAHPVYQARSLSQYALTEQLEALADNPRHAQQTNGLLVVNPTPFARRDYVLLSKALFEGKYDHLSSTAHRLMEYREMLAQGKLPDAVLAGPIDVPVYGFVKMPMASLNTQDLTTSEEPNIGALESSLHRIEYDADSGAITALIDKRSGVNLADTSSTWPMLSLIHEAADSDPNSRNKGRDVMFNLDYGQFQEHSFVANWPAKRTLEQVKSVYIVKQPHRVGLEAHSSLPGAPEIVKRIWLHHHRAEIAIEIELRKDDVRTPDAIYLALPLNLPNWEATFDTMGAPTQLDTEQLPGCCRDWVTVSGYVDVHNADAGVTLACPDMPLAMVGDFNFGKRQLALDHTRPPLLLAWLLNNYWTTNFRVSQPGFLRFRYELATHSGFDPIEAARVAAFARNPLIAHPVAQQDGTQQGALLAVEDSGVMLAACERLEDGALLWLQNVTNEEHIARVRLPGREISAASLCNIFGEATGPLPVEEGVVSAIVPARGLVGIIIWI